MSDRPLENRRFLIFVDEGYEDLELWYPKLRLEEAGAQVTVAGRDLPINSSTRTRRPASQTCARPPTSVSLCGLSSIPVCGLVSSRASSATRSTGRDTA